MKDYLVRGMSMDGFVKVVAIRSTEMVKKGAQIHGTTPNATAAFGRCLTAASMMGNMQKVEDGSMTMQVRGGGPIGTITVVSDPVGNVRGCMTEPKVPLVEKYAGKLDVGATVGTDGTLTIIRDLQMKEPYIGSIQLISGEIGDDVTAYFVQSEDEGTLYRLHGAGFRRNCGRCDRLLRPVRTDPYRLRSGRAGRPGSVRKGGRRLSGATVARRA